MDGIELFIEKNPDRPRYAQIILELGGREVGPFEAGLGLCVGHLLESCTHTDVDELPPEQRRARAVLAVRAMIATFAHSTPLVRTKGIEMAEASPPAIQDILNEGQFPSNRWIEWVDVFLWEVVLELRRHKDSTISLHVSYLTALLFHRAVTDVAYRIQEKDVQITAPADWNLRKLLAVLKRSGDERVELYELAVAVLLLPRGDKRPRGYEINYSLPDGYEEPKKARDKKLERVIAVSVKKARGEEIDGETEPVALVSPETLRGEALLVALSFLINDIPTGVDIEHSDVLSRVILAIVPGKGLTLEGTSPKLQQDFIDALDKHHRASPVIKRSRSVSATTAVGDAEGARVTSPSIFHLTVAMDRLITIIELIDHPDLLEKASELKKHAEDLKPQVLEPSMFKQEKLRQSAATDRPGGKDGLKKSTSQLGDPLRPPSLQKSASKHGSTLAVPGQSSGGD